MLLAAGDVEPSRSGLASAWSHRLHGDGGAGMAALASLAAARRTGGGRGRPRRPLNGGYQATFWPRALIAGVAALLSAALVHAQP